MNSLVKYRPAPLSKDAYEKLHNAAERVLSFKIRYAPCVISVKDEYGDNVEKRDYSPSGYEVFKKGEIVPELLQSVCRPSFPQHTAVHLTRLADHKPFGRGKGAWKTVIEDLCNFLEDVSEFAIIKICEKYKLDAGITFFPDTAILVKDIKDFDFSLKQLKAEKQPDTIQPEIPDAPLTESQEHKKRVVTICGKVARRESLTPDEQQFYDDLKARA